MNVLPENCLVLEDSEAGIEAAYRAGIPVICIPDLKMPAQSFLNKTEQVFQDLDAVRDYLESRRRINESRSSRCIYHGSHCWKFIWGMDRIYLTNRVLARVGEGVLEVETDLDELIDLKDQLVEEAVRLETIETVRLRVKSSVLNWWTW